jgi:hypothetical protein
MSHVGLGGRPGILSTSGVGWAVDFVFVELARNGFSKASLILLTFTLPKPGKSCMFSAFAVAILARDCFKYTNDTERRNHLHLYLS